MNAYIEAFHSVLEDECLSRHEFSNFSEAYAAISEYIEYYNCRRRHGSLNYMAPKQYHLQKTKEKNRLAAWEALKIKRIFYNIEGLGRLNKRNK